MPRRHHGIILVRRVIAEINYALDEIPGRRGVTIRRFRLPRTGNRGGRDRTNKVNRVENRGNKEERSGVKWKGKEGLEEEGKEGLFAWKVAFRTAP